MAEQPEIGREERLCCRLRTAARAAATAPGAAAAASSAPALRTARRARRLPARPARAHAPAPTTRAHRPPPGTRWGRRAAGTPRPARVSAGSPAGSPAPRGRPPAPGRGSEPGRRVSTARRARCLLPFSGKPSLDGECHTASAQARVPQPYERAENGAKGHLTTQLWEGATNGAQEGASNFPLPALLPSGGDATADCRAERTHGRGTLDISVQCLSVCSS